jgi:hypothetical protein
MDAFFSWTRTAAMPDAKHGKDGARWLHGLRLTPFDAGLQSFPWQPNCPANHKLARDDLACRRALRRCDQAGPIEAA